MTTPVFKKSMLISLAGHFAFFCIFSISFGAKLPSSDYALISFWGEVLEGKLLAPAEISGRIKEKVLSLRSSILPAPGQLNLPLPDAAGSFIKPVIVLPAIEEKIIAKEDFSGLARPLAKKDSFILFHPLLPYSFPLYFKDRQSAHVELLFNPVNGPSGRYILIKRKISSGNLEVDLLVMRYIENYLYIQQARFSQNSWQSVKIELSAKSD